MKISPKRILWPTDFSELSLHAGRYARGFCELAKAEMHIVHVVPPPLIPDVSVIVPAEVPIAVSEKELLEAADEALQQVVSEHFDGDARIVRASLSGSAWSEICDYAKEHEVDLIVIGTHGRTGLAHTLLGGTAERVIQHAPCPVLTVKESARDFLVE